MKSKSGPKTLLLVALVAAMLLVGTPSATASDQGIPEPDPEPQVLADQPAPQDGVADEGVSFSRRVRLDDEFKGWFSNGMANDAAACGPFAASTEAVVWHLYAELPDGTEDAVIKNARANFGGRTQSEIEVSKDGRRVDMWARVSIKDPSNPVHVRRGAHTNLRWANVRLNQKAIPQDGSVTLHLGNVCYEGLGPVGQINIYLQALTCDSYSRIRGNEITPDSEQWDATAGGWEEWRKIYDGNAPKVRLRKKAGRGCEFDANQQFAVGTSAQMDNYMVLPGSTNAEDGLLTLSSGDLSEVHQRALFWVHDQLWFQWVENQEFGAIQCYKDRMHADTVEWVDISNYNRLPKDIYCVAWNVSVEHAAAIELGVEALSPSAESVAETATEDEATDGSALSDT